MTTHHVNPLIRTLARALAITAFVTIPSFASAADENSYRQPGSSGYSSSTKSIVRIDIPKEDRFVPFAKEIRVGDTVLWVNYDTDDHTVVSDDYFNTVGNKHIDYLIPGTDKNHGKPGTYRLKFGRPGTFVYYCRFHAHLDSYHQPVAPGPDGGIQDKNGNYGTPMMGVITVLPAKY
jgi:plastocyanin